MNFNLCKFQFDSVGRDFSSEGDSYLRLVLHNQEEATEVAQTLGTDEFLKQELKKLAVSLNFPKARREKRMLMSPFLFSRLSDYNGFGIVALVLHGVTGNLSPDPDESLSDEPQILEGGLDGFVVICKIGDKQQLIGDINALQKRLIAESKEEALRYGSKSVQIVYVERS